MPADLITVDTAAPVLGVASSATGRRWMWRESDARIGLAIAQRLDLPELPGKGSYHTVAGLMLALLQRVPREGDRIVWGGWRFEIVDMDGRRVDKVLAHREEATGA